MLSCLRMSFLPLLNIGLSPFIPPCKNTLCGSMSLVHTRKSDATVSKQIVRYTNWLVFDVQKMS